SVCEGKGDIRIAARDERHVVHRGVRRFHRSGVAFHELVDDLRVTAANRVVDTTRAACCDGQRGLGGTETYDYGRENYQHQAGYSHGFLLRDCVLSSNLACSRREVSWVAVNSVDSCSSSVGRLRPLVCQAPRL